MGNRWWRVGRGWAGLAISSALLCALALWQSTSATTPDVAPVRLRWALQPAESTAVVSKGDVRATFSLTNTSARPLPGNRWALYFTCTEGVETGVLQGRMTLERVVGTLYRLRPTQDSGGLHPGETLQVAVVHPDTLVNFAQAPDGPYFVYDDNPDAGLPVTDYEMAPFPLNRATSAEQIYDRNATISPVAESLLPPIVPTPREYERRSGLLQWATLPRVVGQPALRAEIDSAIAILEPHFPTAKGSARALTAVSAASTVRLSIGKVAGLPDPEAYQLNIDPNSGVNLKGASAAGVARGLASLRQLLPVETRLGHAVELPALLIRDAPRFAYRGMMLDVARNFQPKANVLRVLDLMSRYKLNTFHFHLTDDEGWRLEITGLPELTEVGSRREHAARQKDRLPPAYGSGPDSRSPYGTGYYRRSDYIDILKYAAARHIEVIPEIEMPGHARAAVVSMAARAERQARAGKPNARAYLLNDPQDQSEYESPQNYNDNVMNPGLPSTYSFIEHVVTEIVALHRAAGVPLHTMHMGGDELPDGAWERSPACRALMDRQGLKTRADLWDYFYARVSGLLKKHGVALAGWEELGARTVGVGDHTERVANPAHRHSGYTVYVWRNTEGAEDLADRLANAGYDTVLTPANRLYFDLPPYPSPFEPGQVWAGFVDLDTVFDYVPLDDTRIASDDPRHLPDREQLTEFGRQHIRGLEGTLFSETVHEPGRLDYMLMPRMVALAERAWAADPQWTRQPDQAHAAPLLAAAWSTFVSQLGLKVLPQLDAEHAVLYRIPAPGLKRVAGAVLVNQQIPGFSLHYTVDGSEPTATSPLVAGPITHVGTIHVAAVDRNGRVGRSSQVDLQ